MKTTIAFGLILAAIRVWVGFNMPPEKASLVDVYKDVAHVYMGDFS